MTEKRPVLLLASAAVLTLALQQAARAESAPAAEPAAPAAAEAAAAPSPAEAAAEARAERAAATQERMEKRHQDLMAERHRHYEQLRGRAAEVGLSLPETPPWEQAGAAAPQMPEPPAMGAAPAMPEPPPMPPMPAMPEPPAMGAAPAMPEPPPMPPMPPMPAMPEPPAMGGAPAMPEPPPMPEMPAMPGAPEMPAAAGGEAGPGAATPRGPMTAEEREARREQHYQAMRERAKAMGIELPEMPPWKLMSEEEREVRREVIRTLTPEQRALMRDAHWAEMRERAKAQGIEMPETPPWKQAEQRRQEMREKWETYRRTVEQMSEEQREAAAAVFGRETQAAPQMPAQMPPKPPMGAPYGGGMPQGPMPGYGRQGMMPGYGGQGGMPPGAWYVEQMLQGPPPPNTGYQGW